MPLLNATDRRFLETLSVLSYCNPFLPERLEFERQALGGDFDETESVWSKHDELDGERVNVERLTARVEPLVSNLRDQLAGGADATEKELTLYEDLVQYWLYYEFRNRLKEVVDGAEQQQRSARRVSFWKEFQKSFKHFLDFSDRSLPTGHVASRMFADFFQIRRAFHHIYSFIVGRSMPAALLRAAVWQSIFTHDMRRYRRSLQNCMGDFTTLIAGPSGTGKELVAQAIGMSRHISFDEDAAHFEEDFAGSFFALNLSALSPTLIESELFGHCRGAFTGAMENRQGWLEICSPLGTVFLDEIGELDPAIQVKLLRVLQTRLFQRLGESTDRHFRGKIIAATNRDLAVEMSAGRFREDFYYRLCSDMITTPSLSSQLADAPEDLHNLILFIARRIAGDEAEEVAREVEAWIEKNLGRDYDWPGNIRELEQCVRNVMIRKQYIPPPQIEDGQAADPQKNVVSALQGCDKTADELLRTYCTVTYAKLGSYEQTAKLLGLDRRTVKAKIDDELLAELRD